MNKDFIIRLLLDISNKPDAKKPYKDIQKLLEENGMTEAAEAFQHLIDNKFNADLYINKK